MVAVVEVLVGCQEGENEVLCSKQYCSLRLWMWSELVRSCASVSRAH